MRIDIDMEEILHNAGHLIRGHWVDLVNREGAVDTRTYRDGIQVGDAFVEGMDGTIRVIATAPHSIHLEKGHVAFNLADKLDPRLWKEGKNGKYFRIAFRWYGYRSPKQIERQGISNTAARMMLPRNLSAAARRLGDYGETKDRLGFSKNPGNRFYRVNIDIRNNEFAAKQARRFEGLIRNQTVYPESGARQSTYHTIRTITPESEWIIPAMRGRKFAERTAKQVSEPVKEYIAGAVKDQILDQITQTAASVFAGVRGS